LTAGCIVAAPGSGVMASYLGRRLTMLIAGIIMMVGAIIQTTSHTIPQMYAGRFISGLGFGTIIQISPLYIAECAPPRLRASAVGTVQVILTAGEVLSYWMGYGVNLHQTGNHQWRSLIGFQIVLGGIYLVGLFFVPESPRFYAEMQVIQEAVLRKQGLPAPSRFQTAPASKGDEKDINDGEEKAHELGYSASHQEGPLAFHPTYFSRLTGSKIQGPSLAVAALAYVRQLPASSEIVQTEMAEIYAQIDELQAAKAGKSWVTLLKKPSTQKRFGLAIFCGVWSAWAGSGAATFYGPTIFASLGLSSTKVALFASGLLQIVSFIFTMVMAYIGVLHYGRLRAMQVGASLAAICTFGLGAILATHPVDPAAPKATASAYGCIFLVYLLTVVGVLFIDAIVYIYAAEIFPIGLREPGMAGLHVGHLDDGLPGHQISRDRLCRHWVEILACFRVCECRRVGCPDVCPGDEGQDH